MDLIPAIDVLGGQVVRLHQGRYDAVTVYGDDPAVWAKTFFDAGATRLHVVDLDGARDGAPGNVAVIERILRAAPLRVQIGGGVRTAESAERWLRAGAARVVLGTAAVRDPAFAMELCAAHPGAVVVAIDAHESEVKVRGWLESTGLRARELAHEVDAWGVAAVLFTAIERDGTSAGPDVRATAALQSGLRATVIASGGIGSLAHLEALREAGVRATVCGRALYSGAFTLGEAFAACGPEEPG
jgi:phosphoribosylformimino-5-aminoimidazole carboxamide ribotide isomerase